MFISGMSASLRSLSVTETSNAPLSFKITRQNEYINFYKADDFKLDDGTSITEIGLRLNKITATWRLYEFFTVRSMHNA